MRAFGSSSNGEKMDQDTVWFPRVEFALTSPMEGGADFTGIGGGFRVESVADLPWNGWQLCYGISGNILTEYASWNIFALGKSMAKPKSGVRFRFPRRKRVVINGERMTTL